MWETLNESPNAWSNHQIIIVALSIAIPSMAFYISNTLNQELILAYEVTSRSNAIVTTLFPEHVRKRIMDDKAGKSSLRKYTANNGDAEAGSGEGGYRSNPIADLYPDTTVMFADISGFTSWSSDREPTEVFILLESIYEAFDRISKHYGIFKVETSKSVDSCLLHFEPSYLTYSCTSW